MTVTMPGRTALRSILLPRPGPFPPDFLFGVGTSDHQAEAFDPRFPDVWDDWEASHPIRHPDQSCCVPRGRATDFWHRYPEDVELARHTGRSDLRRAEAARRVNCGSWARAGLRPVLH